MLEKTVHQTSQLVRRRRDRLGCAHTRLQTTQKRTQRALTAVQGIRRQTQGAGRAVGARLGPTRQHLAPRDAMVGAQTQPATKMLDRRPTLPVRADLTEHHQRRGLLDPLDHRPVHSCHPVQRPPRVERRPVVAPPLPPRLGRQRLTATFILELFELPLDLAIAGGDLLMIEVVQRQRLLQREQVLGSPVALQGPGDVRLTCGRSARRAAWPVAPGRVGRPRGPG